MASSIAMGMKRTSPLVMTVPDAPDVPADYGFNPLNLRSNSLAFLREAELKHGRLSMMTAIALTLQEVLHTPASGLIDALYGEAVMTTPDVATSLALFALGCAALEEGDVASRRLLGCSWREYPAGWNRSARADLLEVQERELFNSRVAMLAVSAYAFTEVVGIAY